MTTTDMDRLREIGRLKAENERLMRMVADLTEFIGFKMSPRVGSSGSTQDQKTDANVIHLASNGRGKRHDQD